MKDGKFIFFYRSFHCHCRRPCLRSLLYIRLTNLSPMVLSFYPLPPPPRFFLSLSLSLPLSLFIGAPFYGYSKLLKATRKGKKSKQGFDVTPGNLYGNLPHSSAGRALTAVTRAVTHITALFYTEGMQKNFSLIASKSSELQNKRV